MSSVLKKQMCRQCANKDHESKQLVRFFRVSIKQLQFFLFECLFLVATHIGMDINQQSSDEETEKYGGTFLEHIVRKIKLSSFSMLVRDVILLCFCLVEVVWDTRPP